MKAPKLTKLVLAVALAAPLFASATSDISTGAGALTATGNLDFRIIIPKFLFLQVGTGTFLVDDAASIDMVEFNVPLASLGAGPVAQTSPASITARVAGNNGAIGLTATTAGAMSNGAGDTISFTTITAAAAGATSFAHPVFVDGGTSAPVAIAPNIGAKVTDRSSTWTFSYSNAAIVPAGTYGGTVPNNGRVTYTASMP
ncbi:MAG: hypothetical protein AB7P08_01520 [Burkholderiales bacterium]